VEITVLTENPIIFSVTNCIDRNCLLFTDSLVMLGYGEVEDLSREHFLDELPDLQLKMGELKINRN
jgi:hypothetical protein